MHKINCDDCSMHDGVLIISTAHAKLPNAPQQWPAAVVIEDIIFTLTHFETAVNDALIVAHYKSRLGRELRIITERKNHETLSGRTVRQAVH